MVGALHRRKHADCRWANGGSPGVRPRTHGGAAVGAQPLWKAANPAEESGSRAAPRPRRRTRWWPDITARRWPRRSRPSVAGGRGLGVQAFPEAIALAQDAIAEVIALSAHPTVRASRARRASPRFPAIMGPMLDTHTVARSLTNAGCTPAQADAITNALRLVVERGDLDAGAVAQSLTEVKFTPALADAITNAINLAAEHRRRPRS